MAVAMRPKFRALRVPAALLPTLLLAASCMTSGVFNHDAHMPVVKENCAPCHGPASQDPRAAIPDDCAVCHPQVRDPAPGAAGKYGDAFNVASDKRSAIYREVIFAHKTHAEAGVGCAICHPPKTLSGKPAFPSMAQCTSCHDRSGKSAECSTCHRERRKGVAPSSHDADWEIRHGEISRTMKPTCTACHEDRSCSDCHATCKPRSHVGGWDKSAHGFQALEERTKCATCHEAAYCTRCHSVPPPSHNVGNFRFSGHKSAVRFNARSCAACHEQVFCKGCHV